jgi:hypothetical protein
MVMYVGSTCLMFVYERESIDRSIVTMMNMRGVCACVRVLLVVSVRGINDDIYMR